MNRDVSERSLYNDYRDNYGNTKKENCKTLTRNQSPIMQMINNSGGFLAKIERETLKINKN